MSDREFKETQLDTKSASFCAAKWYNATIWLGSGMTTSCHHPPAHKIPLEGLAENPSLIHNTPEKKEDRRKMQVGERPPGCDYCWTIEDAPGDNLSDRVYKSRIYSEESLDQAFKTPHEQDVNLQTLEIAFDRTCNFACSYCNPAFSTTWAKDIKQKGEYTGLKSDGRNHFTHPHDSAQLFKVNEHNPYVEAFFKWWETDLHKTLQELRITGGEPMMSADLWRLIDWFEKHELEDEPRLAINSNLGGKKELIDRLIDKSHSIKHLHIYTSCEAMGPKAEYIRDGLDWLQFTKNINRLCTEGNVEGLHMMCTINALCLDSLVDFLNYLLEIKKTYGAEFPVFTLNILRFPSFQSPLVLSNELKHKYTEQLETWLETHRESSLLQGMEVDQVQRLIYYLKYVSRPHKDSFEIPKLQNDFRKFYEQYDQRRHKDFRATFPDLVDWYDSLEEI